MTDTKAGQLPDVWMTHEWIRTEARRQGLAEDDLHLVFAVVTTMGEAADRSMILKSLMDLSSEPDEDGVCSMVKPKDFDYVLRTSTLLRLVRREHPHLFDDGQAISICRRFIEALAPTT